MKKNLSSSISERIICLCCSPYICRWLIPDVNVPAKDRAFAHLQTHLYNSAKQAKLTSNRSDDSNLSITLNINEKLMHAGRWCTPTSCRMWWSHTPQQFKATAHFSAVRGWNKKRSIRSLPHTIHRGRVKEIRPRKRKVDHDIPQQHVMQQHFAGLFRPLRAGTRNATA